MFKSVIFEVIGDQRIFCDGCERRVENLLKNVPGVRQVRADSRKQQIEVLADAAESTPRAVTERLAEAGYEAQLADSSPA